MTTDERVDGYLAKMPSEMHAVAAMLRAVLVGFGPKLTETYKWAQPVYELNGPVCGFRARTRSYVTLVFWRSAELMALDAALETGGSKMAHRKFTTAAEVRPAQIKKKVVRAGMTLNTEHGDPTKKRG